MKKGKTNKHMTIEERLEIQRLISLNRDENGHLTIELKEIGKILGRDPTTVSKEVKQHRVIKEMPIRIRYSNAKAYCRNCQKESKCKVKNSCGINCPDECKGCISILNKCEEFILKTCVILNKFPYVCNGCPKRNRCGYSKAYYKADKSQKEYEETLSNSRIGLNMSENEFNTMNLIVSEELRKGQSVDVIVHNHKEELPVGTSSIYRYINMGILSADKFNTRHMVSMKPRKEKHENSVVIKAAKVGKMYEEFLICLRKEQKHNYVEMDTIEGTKGGKVVLSLYFTESDLQLYYLMNGKHAICVVHTLDRLQEKVENVYRDLFGIILTDNGVEFSDIKGIEVNMETGELRTKLFFCHPQATNEKSRCERNHELFRYILPKGTSFDHLTQKDLDLVMSHVNSYKRKSTDYATPIDIFCAKYGPKVCDSLGLTKIPAELVNLTPNLLK